MKTQVRLLVAAVLVLACSGCVPYYYNDPYYQPYGYYPYRAPAVYYAPVPYVGYGYYHGYYRPYRGRW